MITPQRPYDIRNFESRRLQFVLVLTVLAGVVPAGAQETSSSTDLTSMLHRTRASSAFGPVDAGTSDAVDASVQSFTGVSSSGYAGELASSGHTDKAPTSRDKLLAKSPAVGMISRDIKGSRPRGLSERAQKEKAHPVRSSATMQGFGAGSAVSLPMQSGPPSDILKQEPSFEDSTGTESGIATGDIGGPHVGFERIGESFETSQSTSFEAPCGQGCGLSAHFGAVEGKHAGANVVSAGRLFGQLTTSESRLQKGTSGQARLRIYGGSNNHR
jgi:hypothetical protein